MKELLRKLLDKPPYVYSVVGAPGSRGREELGWTPGRTILGDRLAKEFKLDED